MWNGNLGRMTAAKHRIKLAKKDVSSVHSAPYRAEPEVRQFTGAEIDRLLQKDVVKPGTTE